MRLENKVAIITVASNGIGREIALGFAREGANVAVGYAGGKERAEAVAAQIREMGRQATVFQMDIAKPEDAQRVVDETMAAFGRIDILVNNAGITRDGLLMRMSKDQWDAVIHANLDSVFNLTKGVQRYMLKQRSGSIINMSSVVGIKGNAGQANYAASKAGIIGFTKSVALELGSRGIRCNAIAPGFIATEMTESLDPKVLEGWLESIPLKRAGTVEDIANACLYLGSDLSSYVTGQVLSVNGGMLT